MNKGKRQKGGGNLRKQGRNSRNSRKEGRNLVRKEGRILGRKGGREEVWIWTLIFKETNHLMGKQ